MRVLIGYDGSDCSDAAVDGLARAGLPEAPEVMVVTVADVWPGSLDTGVETMDEAELAKLHGIPEGDVNKLPAVLRRAYDHSHRELEHAKATAERGAGRLRLLGSGWKVESEGVADPPGWGIVRQAEKWKADLVVVGSHGRTGLRRILLGSVSHFVLNHSKVSLRISRCREGTPPAGPVKLVVGVDGSEDAENALREVGMRRWGPGTEVRVVAALDPRLLTMPLMAGYPSWGFAGEFEQDERSFYEKMVTEAAGKLGTMGLGATAVVREGDPKWVLVDEAERWGADCIFVGARGHGVLDRLLVGSVSMAVAERAHCSVEVVRPRR